MNRKNVKNGVRGVSERKAAADRTRREAKGSEHTLGSFNEPQMCH